MGSIFGSPGMVKVPEIGSFTRAYSILTIGGNQVDFPMIDVSEGKQGARIQIDAALDGSIYAVGTTDGVGTYTMVFLDGGIKECSGNATANSKKESSVIQKYNTLKKLSDRKAVVKIFSSDSSTVKSDSAALTTFNGIITNMGISLVDVGGAPFLRVALSMIGAWK